MVGGAVILKNRNSFMWDRHKKAQKSVCFYVGQIQESGIVVGDAVTYERV